MFRIAAFKLTTFKISTGSALLAIGLLAGCSTTQKTAAVSDNIRKSLVQAGLKDVSVTQDRDKGVVTLGGHVATDADKANANQIAQSLAANQVVANQVAVLPVSDSGPAKTVYADLDKGIDSNLDAALISNGYKIGIGHSVKNGVVTLTGTIDNASQRTQLETIAQGVPNTQQVVNEIQTRHQKATSSN
jgi:osmotically-inducible protein OsmY